jgi:hypothetical protein
MALYGNGEDWRCVLRRQFPVACPAASGGRVMIELFHATSRNATVFKENSVCCTICLKNIRASKAVGRTTCCHMVCHVCCLGRWAREGHQTFFTCPNCRAHLNKEKYKRGTRFIPPTGTRVVDLHCPLRPMASVRHPEPGGNPNTANR